MRIAFIMPDDFSILLFAKRIIKALQRLPEAEVTALCSLGPYRQEVEALGIKTVHVGISRFFNPFLDLHYMFNLFLLLRKHRFDVVFNFSTKPNIYGTIAARLAGVRMIISHVVGLGAAFAPGKSLTGNLLTESFLGLYRIACRLSDKVWFTNPKIGRAHV